MSRTYGEAIDGLMIGGRPINAGVFDENQVKAAAGLTLVLGAIAFVYAYFGKEYVPIKVVTTFFFIEFLVRVSMGIKFSPVGMIARLLVWKRSPHWVSAKPKRFAWSLGLVLSLAMTVITNSDIRGGLPLSICMLCMTLMWLEAVLGLCLGCETYRFMMHRGWVRRDAAFEVCNGDACSFDAAADSTMSVAADSSTRRP